MLLAIEGWSQPIYRRGGFQFAFTSDSALTSDFLYAKPDSGRTFGFRVNGIAQFAGVKPSDADFISALQVSTFPTLGFKKGNWIAEAYMGLTLEDQANNLPASYGLGQKPVESFMDSRAYITPGGFVKYTPNQHFSFSAGYDKNFIGAGYHSLLLSDNAANAPFLKGSVNFWKVKYSVLYMALNNVESFQYGNQSVANKFTATHVVQFDATKWLQLQLFESIIWQTKDSVNTRGFDFSYLNPVIFFRPVEFNQGSSDNAMLGGGINIKPFKNLTLYSQLLLDEFLLSEFKAQRGWWGNKFGVQAGLKYFNALGIKNLNLLGEVNVVKPYTYSHAINNTNYGHHYASLAHPWGANFYQLTGIAQYQTGRHRFMLFGEMGKKGFDSDSLSYGGNIFIPYRQRAKDYNNTIAQGISVDILNISALYAYQLLPKQGLETFGAIGMRKFGVLTNLTVNIGIRTAFFNSYSNY